MGKGVGSQSEGTVRDVPGRAPNLDFGQNGEPLRKEGSQVKVNPLNLLILIQMPGIGRRKLLECLDAAPHLLSEPIGKDAWQYLEKRLRLPLGEAEKGRLLRSSEKIQNRVAAGEFGLVHFFEAGYPALLKEIFDPPLVLFFKGAQAFLNKPAIAVIGARKSTDYGIAVAQDFSLRLARAGLVIVSGMALGADSAAHVGALKAKGKTVAVLGSGVDVPYPRQAARIYRQICDEGCVVSEFSPGEYPAPQNFPIRNRIISGLCLGTVIVEASERSGSLITARLTVEQGRELFAVPGPVHSPLSVGPNYLIKQGAKLVQIWQDVVDELPAPLQEQMKVTPCLTLEETLGQTPLRDDLANHPLTTDEQRVYNGLFFDRKVHLESLLEQAGLSPGALAGILLKLQFEGLILEVPGQYYIRNVREIP